MANPPRRIAFVLAATDQGTLIVNRFDYHMVDATRGYGVGHTLLESSSYDAPEVTGLLQLLQLRRRYFGDGVIAIDCGANIGVHTVEWAKGMTGWGAVIAIEAQQRIFYALAGNICINNCFNAQALHAAVGATQGSMRIPAPNYQLPGSFGSLELKQAPDTEFIGQAIDYSEARLVSVPAITIDSLNLQRLDLLKIDVERMELEVLQGAARTLTQFRPIIVVEHLKTGQEQIAQALEGYGYRHFQFGLNLLAIHPSDASGQHVSTTKPSA